MLYVYGQVKTLKREVLMPNVDWATVFSFNLNLYGDFFWSEGGVVPSSCSWICALFGNKAQCQFPNGRCSWECCRSACSNGVKANEPRELSKDVFGVNGFPCREEQDKNDDRVIDQER